jgi:enoyl-[acyl-carrier protein] reductase I
VLELDVTRPEHFTALRDELTRRWGRVDGALHAIAFASEDALGGRFLTAPWESVQYALQVSTFSLKELAACLLPLMPEGGSIVTLDFDNRVAWPVYDWMGVCKAALESVVRYLARDLGAKGIRVNAVAAGPLATMAAKSIPGFSRFEEGWGLRAPLGWDVHNADPVARMVAVLLSDWVPATTGEMIHVDGGYHAMGAEIPRNG